MKKIFAVSLIAFMAVSASHAGIVSEGYVAPKTTGENPVAYTSARIVSGATTGANLTALDNALTTATTGQNAQLTAAQGAAVAELATMIGTLPGDAQTVQAAIAAIDGEGGTATTALKSVTANDQTGVVTDIYASGTAVTMVKATSISNDNIATGADIAAGKLSSGVRTSLGKADASIQKTTTVAAGDGIFTKKIVSGNPVYSWEAID